MRKYKEEFFKYFGLLLAAACLLFSVGCGDGKAQTDKKDEAHILKTYNPGLLIQYFGSLKVAINRIVKENGLSTEDIKKIDFSKPNEPGFGDNPALEIYNPQNPNYFKSDGIEKSLAAYVDDPKIIISYGNRVLNAATPAPELLAIVPHIHRDACESLYAPETALANQKILSIKQSLNLSNNPESVTDDQVVEIPYGLGCLETSDGLVFIYPLFER